MFATASAACAAGDCSMAADSSKDDNMNDDLRIIFSSC
jgi:hypothetical protein